MLIKALSHGDAVTLGVFLLLIVASLTTWGVIFYKLLQLTKWAKAEKQAQASLLAGQHDALLHLPEDVASKRLYAEALRLQTSTTLDVWHLQDRLDDYQATLRMQQEQGLTVLASVGSSAPFIGLLGTVWGIMHALQALTGEQLSLDAVAGPVGEALIATAVGLFAAIPALIGYNFIVRWLRSVNSVTSRNVRLMVDSLNPLQIKH